MKTSAIFLILFSAVMTVAQTKSKTAFADTAQLKQLAARFAPTPLQVDTNALSVGDKQALPKLIEAAQLLNVVFMKQYWSGNLATYEKLKADKTPLGQARLRYYWINKGPWSNLEGNKAFMPGVPGHFVPIGSQGFYRKGCEKARFDQQPVEAGAGVSACLQAFHVTGDEHWRREAWIAFNWFLGDNDLQVVLYDASTGGCRDGLHPDRVNENEGAESSLAFLMASLEMRLLEEDTEIPVLTRHVTSIA